MWRAPAVMAAGHTLAVVVGVTSVAGSWSGFVGVAVGMMAGVVVVVVRVARAGVGAAGVVVVRAIVAVVGTGRSVGAESKSK